MIKVINGQVYVCDLKPGESVDINTSAIGNSQLKNIPQISAYAFILMEMFGLKDIKCLLFNKKGGWKFDPIIMCKQNSKFIKKYFSHRILLWEKFFPQFF